MEKQTVLILETVLISIWLWKCPSYSTYIRDVFEKIETVPILETVLILETKVSTGCQKIIGCQKIYGCQKISPSNLRANWHPQFYWCILWYIVLNEICYIVH